MVNMYLYYMLSYISFVVDTRPPPADGKLIFVLFFDMK